ncbi:WxL domain-containing protein [Shouchella miscanthi]|uniref:WxL domain-containing protein n=1 Tax=Shouchella miscanthi TaxID=2598861 RepID=UPI0011A6D88E|nr:WxL domain-containing protein [Shouchella miscanthi]
MKKALLFTVIAAVTLSFSSLAKAENGGTYDSNGSVQFIPNKDITEPLDPENPNPEEPVTPIDPTDPTGPNPGTPGPLSIDYASSLNFGENEISTKDRVYAAKAQELSDGRFVSNYVQITDNRGSNAGWSLHVKQNGQFENENAQHTTLTGASISFSEPTIKGTLNDVTAPTATNSFQLDPEGASTLVMSAAKGAGAGTWVNHFGGLTSLEGGDVITPAIELFVPGVTPKDNTEYRTTLTWTLSDVPGNNN